jgi:hypothetical protein
MGLKIIQVMRRCMVWLMICWIHIHIDEVRRHIVCL